MTSPAAAPGDFGAPNASLDGASVLSLMEHTPDAVAAVLASAAWLARTSKRDWPKLLDGRMIALIFERPSTRTRVSFEVGVTYLGGHALVLAGRDLQMGRGETIEDTAKVLSRMVDAIVLRTGPHATLEELDRYASVPVINSLSYAHHPCQALADALTLLQRFGTLRGLRVAYVGDGNNCCASLMVVGALTGLDWGRTVRAVRVNGIETPWCHDDIIEIVTGARDCIDVLIVPNVEAGNMLAKELALVAQAEGHVVEDRQEREQRVALEHRVDVALVRRPVCDVDSIKQDLAAGRRLEACHHPQRRSLATPRWPSASGRRDPTLIGLDGPVCRNPVRRAVARCRAERHRYDLPFGRASLRADFAGDPR